MAVSSGRELTPTRYVGESTSRPRRSRVPRPLRLEDAMTSTAEPGPAGTIVLIHGLWMTPLSWEKWIEHYEAKGYKVIAPGWPGIDGDPAALRRDPSSLAELGVKEIADHYEKIIRELDEP